MWQLTDPQDYPPNGFRLVAGAKPRHPGVPDAIGDDEKQLAIRPFRSTALQPRDGRIEVRSKPGVRAAVGAMADRAVLAELAAAGLQIVRGRRERIVVQGRVSPHPLMQRQS